MNSPLTNKRLGKEFGEKLAADTAGLKAAEYVEIMSAAASEITGTYRGHISHRIAYGRGISCL